ncbi:MAG: spore coat protein GerQ [Bacilli bacterium]|nr:spore coat protein GerQ [Bacilli bacterium]MDD4808933.1 spore coat protein GerQ [Bacilli bacterium]
MDNKFFNQSGFPGSPIYSGNTALPNQQTVPNYAVNEVPFEQSYIENILRLNRGKNVRVHMTFPDSTEWRDMEFQGIIEESGRDHIILSEPATGKWQLLLMIYVDFITFDERVNYSQQFVPSN